MVAPYAGSGKHTNVLRERHAANSQHKREEVHTVATRGRRTRAQGLTNHPLMCQENTCSALEGAIEHRVAATPAIHQDASANQNGPRRSSSSSSDITLGIENDFLVMLSLID